MSGKKSNLTAELPRTLVRDLRGGLGDIQNDEFHGQGGSYIIDPATGKRVRVEGPALGADGTRPEQEQESGAIVTTETEKTDEIE